mgnify:FL=1
MKSFKQFTVESIFDQHQDLGDNASPEKQKTFIDKHLVQVFDLPSPEYSVPKPIDFRKGKGQRLADLDQEEVENVYEESESEMTDAQKAKREEIVMALKKKMPDFKEKYGERAKDVMYATATKMAMNEEELEEGYKKEGYHSEGVVQDLAKIVKTKSMAQVKFKDGKKKKIDLTTASMVMNAYNQLNGANKKKVEGMLGDSKKFAQFVDFAMQAGK